MSNIRYVVVSDLHLGAANSVLTRLTNDNRATVPHDPSDLLRKLVKCLQHVLLHNEGDEPISLILNGDILELALAGTNQAAMTFECFMDLLFDSSAAADKLAHEVFYLPGNHDHHLWNTAKETQYVEKYLKALPADAAIAPEYYVTNMFYGENLSPVPAYLLNALMWRAQRLAQLSVTTVYPNFALLNSDKTRALLFHHGHYVESIYSLMSYLKDIFFPDRARSDDVWDLEADNGAWIDFFWSTLGRSGEVGASVELIYDKMQDEQQFKRLLENLAREVAQRLSLRWHALTGLETTMISAILAQTVGRSARREVHETESELSADATAGLKRYLEKYALNEIKRGNQDVVPPDVTFIFGHTHKPFERTERFEGYQEPVKLLNSGGWVVDTCEADPLHGGAILFVDDELNAASIRMYNEGDSTEWLVRVSAAVTDRNPLFEWISGVVRPNEEPWKSFSQAARKAVKDHRENLLFNISRDVTQGRLT